MKKLTLLASLALLLFTACEKEYGSSTTKTTDELEMGQLDIPEGFDFSTKKSVQIAIDDPTDNAIYSIYSWYDETESYNLETYISEEGIEVTDTVYRTDVLNQLVYKGAIYNGSLNGIITIPSYYTHLYIRRKEGLKFSSVYVEIVDGKAEYKHVSTKSTSAVEDMLYCVNGAGQLFTVDPETGDLTDISPLPVGSYTAAIDNENRMLYTIQKSKPYPLYKYDIVNDEWTKIKDLGFGGPRLDYNSTDGMLYFSNNAYILVLDPETGNTITQYNINNLNVTNGGDLAFREDGELYLCSFGGLYHLEREGDEYNATRISADNLPFSPTSMTFDKNNELWLANNASQSDLIIMDTETGGWEYRHGINSTMGENTQINRTINDLTTLYTTVDDPKPVDTDNDGIPDVDDEYPEDAEKAFEQYTPSKYGWGTHAFEDLYPEKGDYDFNDIALNYKIIAIANSKNEVVQIDFHINVKNNGAGFVNAYGIQLENVLASDVEWVRGQVHRQGYIELAENGVEAGQSKAVIIPFDDTQFVLDQDIVVEVKLKEPITFDELGTDPFTPFMIVNKIRTKEVHLPQGSPTDLGMRYTSLEPGATGHEAYYVDENGLPWAIDIVHDFKVPLEKVPVNKAYNKFNEWAESGGTSYPDWYKDNDGYRNEFLIKY